MNNEKDLYVVHGNKYGERIQHEERSGSGGSNIKNNNYVTRTELELSNEKLLRHIDEKFNEINTRFDQNDLKFEKINTEFEKIDTKFEKQKVWIWSTGAIIITSTCTIISFLFHFMK